MVCNIKVLGDQVAQREDEYKKEAAVEEVRCYENSLLWAFCFVFFCISDKIMEFLICIPHLRTLPNKSCAFSPVCFFNYPDI